jgi:hypothetical protein
LFCKNKIIGIKIIARIALPSPAAARAVAAERVRFGAEVESPSLESEPEVEK